MNGPFLLEAGTGLPVYGTDRAQLSLQEGQAEAGVHLESPLPSSTLSGQCSY